MKMYVANCTHQVQSFFYRLPETTGVRSQQIDIGSQIRLSGDLTQRDIDSIIEQTGKYGIISEDDIPRHKAFAGLCYQIDKPVSIPRLRMMIERNTEVLVDTGKEIRKQAAVVMSQQIDQQAPGLQALEVTTIEEDRPGHEGEFAEALRVKDDRKVANKRSRR